VRAGLLRLEAVDVVDAGVAAPIRLQVAGQDFKAGRAELCG